MHRAKLGSILLVLATIGLGACGRGDARTAAATSTGDGEPATWDIEVGPASEPGDRLEVTGHVVAGGKALAGVTVYVYHGDAKGHYNLPGHENERPRLHGTLRTNADGAYRVRTSMPGGYDGFPAHVHFEVSGPGLSRRYLFVNLVRVAMDPMEVSRKLRARGLVPTPENLTANERPVFRGADGIFRCVKHLAVGR